MAESINEWQKALQVLTENLEADIQLICSEQHVRKCQTKNRHAMMAYKNSCLSMTVYL